MKTEIVKYHGEPPCAYSDISLSGAGDGECELGSFGDFDCGKSCPDYSQRKIEVCKKHHLEYAAECPMCFDEYWERLGRKEERRQQIEHWLETHLHS